MNSSSHLTLPWQAVAIRGQLAGPSCGTLCIWCRVPQHRAAAHENRGGPPSETLGVSTRMTRTTWVRADRSCNARVSRRRNMV